MVTIPDYKQANSNLARVQGGSQSANRDGFVTGAMVGQPVFFNWAELQMSWLNNNPDFVSRFDHFTGAAISTAWATNLSTGATIAINAQQNGVIRFSTDTDDDDFATLALGLNFLVSKGWTFFEARVKSVTAITLRGIEVGVSDALSETNGLAFSNHSVTGVTAVADNAAVFGYDTDASMTAWALNTVNATVAAASALDPVTAPALTFQRLGIAINAEGDAFFYLDGELVGSKQSAVATTAVLTPWITLKSLSGAIKSIDVDYIAIAGLT